MKRVLVLALVVLAGGFASCKDEVKTYELGDKCDEASFNDYCDGNKIIFCDDGVVSASDCESDDCIKFLGLGFVARCIDPIFKCSHIGIERVCETIEGVSVLFDKNCGSVHSEYEDKYYAYGIHEVEYCAGACTSDTSCDVRRCNEWTFDGFCEGNMATACVDGFVRTFDCESRTCVTFIDPKGTVCINPIFECEGEGEERSCMTVVEGMNIVVTKWCEAVVGGGYRPRNVWDMQFCASECTSSDSCLVQSCLEATYKSSCDGNAALFCYEDEVVRVDCSAYDLTCSMIGEEIDCI
ncbi:MAG: hypothetical protein FWC40_04970 [Proteobacteria bacterium]|nr:hypothetical protein [Pseudomonadota bacterium]